MSDEKFSAKFEVKSSAIPNRIIKDFENVKHPSAIKLIPVAKSQEKPNGSNKSNGLTMMELNQFINDPFWVNLRKTLMIVSILLFITLLVISIFIIVYTPNCDTGLSVDKANRRTRECKSDEECAAIQNTTCMSDPRDYKMRCLCRDSSAPINGACPNRPRAVGSPCKLDNECIEGSECKSMNITVTSFKTCQCKEGYMSKDGYCSSGFQTPAPSLFIVFFGTLLLLLMNKSSLRI